MKAVHEMRKLLLVVSSYEDSDDYDIKELKD